MKPTLDLTWYIIQNVHGWPYYRVIVIVIQKMDYKGEIGKGQIFWEDHKIWNNIQILFDIT